MQTAVYHRKMVLCLINLLFALQVKPFCWMKPFLTKCSYNSGRVTKNMTITVLEIYRREDKEGLFFQVNGESKHDLWPYIKHHVHPETSVIYTDAAKQYKNGISMFPAAIHKTANHSKDYGNSKPCSPIINKCSKTTGLED